MQIQWWEGAASSCAEAVPQSATRDGMSPEAGRMRKRILKSVVEELERRSVARQGTEVGSGSKHAKDSNWREPLHAAAVSTGGERSWISAAVSLSTTIIGLPHLGQDQRSLGPAVEISCSVGGVAPSSWKQSGKVVARLRLARKPKLRMRTKPSGSRCNRKRRKNSSRDRVINFCSLLWAESRQRNVTVPSANETSRWLEMATRWV